MNKFKIILIIFLLSIPSISLAWKWYDIWLGISWSVASGSRICPAWKVLLDKDSSKAQARNWIVNCFRRDNTAPTINASGFDDNKWVNKNVNISVNISDSESWLWKIIYYVNWVEYNASSNFSINLTEEWTYLIQIHAYDKAIIDWNTWWSTIWNLNIKEIIVKIDKSNPNFSDWTDATIWWIKNKPSVKYKITDLYKWVNLEKKVFTCPINPENSKYNYPVIDLKITWICNPQIKANCTDDNNYTPNINDCNWSCNGWYIKVWDKCEPESKILSCIDSEVKIPTNVYYYSKTNDLISEWSSVWKVFWSSPAWVEFEWNFISNYDTISRNYLPSLNNCSYSCNDWYHVESNNWWKCVNDTSVVCCTKPPLWYISDTFFTDCTLAINKDKAQCKYNTLCNWYVKDVLWEWNDITKKWNYTDDSLGNFSNVSNACWYTNLPNSNWFVCDKKYYLIWSETNSTLKCETVPVWEWSSDWVDWNKKFACTNKPNNADYTTNWDNNNCSWTCKNWYEKNWNSCKSYDWNTSGWSNCSESCWWWTKTRSVYCTNSKWQTVNDNNCLWNKPTSTSSCNTQSCPINWNCSFLPWICSVWTVFWDNWVACGNRTWSCLWQFWWNDDSCNKDLWSCWN